MTDSRMKIVYIDVDDLTPLVDNPRKITKGGAARLKASIKSLGFFKPSLVWTSPEGDRHVIGGNQRHGQLTHMKAAGELPFTVEFKNGVTVEVTSELPCVEFLGTEAEARAVALRDNTSDGDWDWDQLPAFTNDLEKSLAGLGDEFDFSAMTGFSDDTLRDLAILAGDSSVRLNRFTSTEEPPAPGGTDGGAGGGGGEPPEGQGGSTMGLTAGFVCGGLRGRVKHETAERFLNVFEKVAKNVSSEDMDEVLSGLLDQVETA